MLNTLGRRLVGHYPEASASLRSRKKPSRASMMRFPVDGVKKTVFRSVVHEFCRVTLGVLGRFTFGLRMRYRRKVLSCS